MKSWPLHFRDAFVVSIKATFAVLAVEGIAIMFDYYIGGNLFEHVGIPIMIMAWLLVHSNALRKLAKGSIAISRKETAVISASVLGVLFVALLLVSVTFLFFRSSGVMALAQQTGGQSQTIQNIEKDAKKDFSNASYSESMKQEGNKKQQERLDTDNDS